MRLSAIKLLPFLLLTILHLPAFAQRQASSRVVAQSTHEPLPQATVRVEGQPNSTVTTDDKGRFSLSLPAEATLIITHIGYQPLTVSADKLGPEVVLEEQNYLIGEVQVSYVQLQKLLLREWKIAPASIDAAARGLLASARAREPKKVEMLEQNPEVVHRVMEMVRYEFRKNGVIKTKLMAFGSKKHWQLDEENRRLTIIDDEGREQALTVVELTADRLVLKPADASLPEVVYVPAA